MVTPHVTAIPAGHIRAFDLSRPDSHPSDLLNPRGWYAHKQCVTALKAVPHDRGAPVLFSGSRDGSLYMWELAGDRWSQKPLGDGHQMMVTGLTFHEGFLYSGSADNRILVWNPVSPEEPIAASVPVVEPDASREGKEQTMALELMSLPGGGTFLVAGVRDGSVVFFDVSSMTSHNPQERRLVPVHDTGAHARNPVSTVKVLTNHEAGASFVLVAHENGKLTVWDMSTNPPKRRGTHRGHDKMMRGIQVAPGPLVAFVTVGEDSNVIGWEIVL